MISSSSSSGAKVVLTLLTEVVALHVRLFVVYVQGKSFQRFISRLLGGRGSSNF